MPQSLANILVHLVFSTKDRAPSDQQEHHRKVSFQDEYRRLLEKHAIQYDERYVWD